MARTIVEAHKAEEEDGGRGEDATRAKGRKGAQVGGVRLGEAGAQDEEDGRNVERRYDCGVGTRAHSWLQRPRTYATYAPVRRSDGKRGALPPAMPEQAGRRAGYARQAVAPVALALPTPCGHCPRHAMPALLPPRGTHPC